ncbi:MAG: sulfite exporter TauE/SafE family protein [Thermovirgaceae bacterium]
MMVMAILLVTFFASGIGTATGFGTSTVMIPILSLFLPFRSALLFVGIIHLFGDVWKILLFRKGMDWKLFLAFGVPGIVASYIGASLAFQAGDFSLKRILGAFFVIYVGFLTIKRDWRLPRRIGTAMTGGALSGLFAGFFGVGGAVRGAFLSAFDLPKEVYIFTSGMIALLIDITRVGRYLWGGTGLGASFWLALGICIPVSFLGAFLAKRFIEKLPQKHFRNFVALFLALVGFRLLFWG